MSTLKCLGGRAEAYPLNARSQITRVYYYLRQETDCVFGRDRRGVLGKVRKIGIDNGEKIQIKRSYTSRGRRVGLKDPGKTSSTKTHKIARFLKQNRTRNTQ